MPMWGGVGGGEPKRPHSRGRNRRAKKETLVAVSRGMSKPVVQARAWSRAFRQSQAWIGQGESRTIRERPTRERQCLFSFPLSCVQGAAARLAPLHCAPISPPFPLFSLSSFAPEIPPRGAIVRLLLIDGPHRSHSVTACMPTSQAPAAYLTWPR